MRDGSNVSIGDVFPILEKLRILRDKNYSAFEALVLAVRNFGPVPQPFRSDLDAFCNAETGCVPNDIDAVVLFGTHFDRNSDEHIVINLENGEASQQ
jgi:hypothetical protein